MSGALAATNAAAALVWRGVFWGASVLAAGCACAAVVEDPARSSRTGDNEGSKLPPLRAALQDLGPEITELVRVPSFAFIVSQGVAGNVAWAALAPAPAVTEPPPAPVSGPTNTTAESSSSSSTTGAIVGGVIGGLAAVAFCAFIGMRVYRKKRGVQIKSIPGPAPPLTDLETAGHPATRPDHSLVLTAASRDSQKSYVKSDDVVLQWISSHPQRSASARAVAAVPAHVAGLEFNWDAAKPLQQLGSGSFGRVYLAEVNHTQVALKVLVDAQGLAAAASQPSKLSSVSSALSSVPADSESSLIKEVTILASLRHPNVVQLVGFCMAPPCVAMEYCARGSLFEVLQRGGSDAGTAKDLPWGRRVRMAADAAAGMLHLHTRSPQVLHRDLKSPNLLVAGDWTVKVGDVGLSKLVEEATRTSLGGTATTAGGGANPRWMAPELLAGERPTAAADVYAFGVVLWELLTWQLPWSNGAVFAIALAVSKGDRPAVPAADDLPGPPGGRPSPAALKAYVALMQRCWAHDPVRRPDFQGVAAELAAVAVLG